MRSSCRAFLPSLAGAIAAAVMLCAGATAASASTFSAGNLVQAPDNPLAPLSSTCSSLVAQQTAAGSINFPDAEVEPYVAVDPTNSNHLVASFQQDRWNDGGSNGLTNVVSTDGGATWSLATSQPQFSVCEGATSGSPGFFNRSTDPWVSFSSDGKIVYSISDSFNANGPAFGGASSIVISRSTDGGATWDTPVTARLDTSTTVLNDKESVTADPVDPNTAYAAWDQLVSPSSHANPGAFNHSPAFRGPSYFSKTTDGGQTWSKGRAIFDPGQKNQTIGNVIVAPSAGPAAGTLFDGFDLINTAGGKGHHGRATDSVALIHSSNGGATWSAPTIAAREDVAHVSIAGQPVRSSDELPEFTAGPEGNLYAVWQDARFSPTGNSKIAFSMSTDGGLTWSTPVRIDQSTGDTPAFLPQVHAAADGTIGVTYDDFENATAAKPGDTDVFIVHCHTATTDCSDPASWASGGETRLSPSSFDLTTAPSAGGFFVGDYQGLTSGGVSGNTFDPFFMEAQPVATNGPTDPFSNTAG